MQIHIVDAVIKGILMGLIMAISVGPTLFAILKYSLNFSYKAGLAFVLGVSASDMMFVTTANFAASWLEALKPYERYIAFGGSIALIGVGLVSLLKKHDIPEQSATPPIISGGHYFRIGLSGFLVNTLNPSVMLTWIGAVTITANTPGIYRFILFTVALVLILGLDFSKVFLADRIKRLLTPKRIVVVQKVSAICILLMGVVMLVSTLFNTQFKNGEKSELDKILTGNAAPAPTPAAGH